MSFLGRIKGFILSPLNELSHLSSSHSERKENEEIQSTVSPEREGETYNSKEDPSSAACPERKEKKGESSKDPITVASTNIGEGGNVELKLPDPSLKHSNNFLQGTLGQEDLTNTVAKEQIITMTKPKTSPMKISETKMKVKPETKSKAIRDEKDDLNLASLGPPDDVAAEEPKTSYFDTYNTADAGSDGTTDLFDVDGDLGIDAEIKDVIQKAGSNPGSPSATGAAAENEKHVSLKPMHQDDVDKIKAAVLGKTTSIKVGEPKPIPKVKPPPSDDPSYAKPSPAGTNDSSVKSPPASSDLVPPSRRKRRYAAKTVLAQKPLPPFTDNTPPSKTSSKAPPKENGKGTPGSTRPVKKALSLPLALNSAEKREPQALSLSAEPSNKKQKASELADHRPQALLVWEGSPNEDLEGGWPAGWTKKVYQRASGNSKGHTDRYWFSPHSRFKFRSMVEVRKFLVAVTSFNGDEVLAHRNFKTVTLDQDKLNAHIAKKTETEGGLEL